MVDKNKPEECNECNDGMEEDQQADCVTSQTESELSENEDELASSDVLNNASASKPPFVELAKWAAPFTWSQPIDVSGASEALKSMATVMNSVIKPEVFESIRSASQAIVNALPAYREMMEKLSKSMRGILEDLSYLNRLRDAQWPLYLVADEEMSASIRELEGVEGDELMDEVAQIAYSHLDDGWLATVKESWLNQGDLSEGESHVLEQALDHHAKGDYYASVALLMCMSEGLVEKYCGRVKRLEGEDLNLFNDMAPDFGLNPLDKNGRRKGRSLYTKDLLLVLVLQVETGAYVWSLASSYIIETVLANHLDENHDRHPRRNKICHGKQTEFGTLEHSLKAILSIDIIIRLGRMVTECDMENEERRE